MLDTRACLQLPGLSPECYRLYESIDAECLPILAWDLPGVRRACGSHLGPQQNTNGLCCAAGSHAASDPMPR